MERRRGPRPQGTKAMEPTDLDRLMEALIFVSRQPVAPQALARAAQARIADVRESLARIRDACADRGIRLEDVAGGVQFRTMPEAAEAVKRLIKTRPVRMSRASLETLTIVAYQQPCTRARIDDIRGVDSGPVLKILQEKGLVRIIGKKEEPGRPYLYGTTPRFLEIFGLASLEEMPRLEETIELSEEEVAAAGIPDPEPDPGEALDEALDDFLDDPSRREADRGGPGAEDDGEEPGAEEDEEPGAEEDEEPVGEGGEEPGAGEDGEERD